MDINMMFSDNKRISGRQAFRLLTYDLLGLGTLLAPTVIGRTAGRDGIFCIAIGLLAALLYLKLLSGILGDMKEDYAVYLREQLGRFCGNLVLAGYLVYFVLLAAYTAYMFANLVLTNLLREESFWLVLILILLLSCYSLWEGLEGRARVYEILFWIIMIPFFLMLFSALDEIKVDYWTPIFSADPGGVISGSYYVFLMLAPVFLMLFLGGSVKKKEALTAAARRALLLVVGIHAALYLILLGIFGANALGTMKFPAVTLMSSVRISGGFLKRTDAFMFAVWFFTLYALLNSMSYYGAMMLKELTAYKKAQKERKAERVATAAVLAAVLAAAGTFYRSAVILKDYEAFLWYVGTPFVVLAPLLAKCCSFFRKRGAREKLGAKGRAVGMLLFVLAAGTVLSGCGTAELEERSFPIEAAVKDTDLFEQAWLEASEGGNRVIDYNHLKVVIISQSLLEDQEAAQELLVMLEKKTDVPRSTYVVAAKEPEEILSLESGGESIGNYLEQLFENVSEVKKTAYPTLGTMYQEQQNRQETLMIPVVEAEDEQPVIGSYLVWKRGQASGTVDSNAALLSFFTQNETDTYTLLLENGGIKLFDAHNEILFPEKENRIEVDIYCSGEILYREGGGTVTAALLEQQAQDYMNDCAADVLSGSNADVTNSYRKLGGYDRDRFYKYRKNDAAYEEEMDILYRLHITWTTLS